MLMLRLMILTGQISGVPEVKGLPNTGDFHHLDYINR